MAAGVISATTGISGAFIFRFIPKLPKEALGYRRAFTSCLLQQSSVFPESAGHSFLFQVAHQSANLAGGELRRRRALLPVLTTAGWGLTLFSTLSRIILLLSVAVSQLL